MCITERLDMWPPNLLAQRQDECRARVQARKDRKRLLKQLRKEGRARKRIHARLNPSWFKSKPVIVFRDPLMITPSFFAGGGFGNKNYRG